MFEYWQDAGARAKSPKRKSPPKRKSSGKVGTVKILKNGAKGKWVRVNGKTVFRIFQGLSPRKFKSQVASKRGSKKRTRISKVTAQKAMNRYYNKRHTDPVDRAIAVGRDMCGSNKPVVSGSRYLRSPMKYDFKGLDDGSNCSHKPTRRRRMSPKAKKELVARLQKGKASAARRAANKSKRGRKAATRR